MNPLETAILTVCAATASLGRGARSGDPHSSQPPTELIQLSQDLPIIFHRTGGFAGVDDRVVIWPDGLVQRGSRRLEGAAAYTMSPVQHDQIRMALARCEARPASRSGGAMDIFFYTIQHGGQTIHTDDLSMSSSVRDLVQQIDRALYGATAITSPEVR